jgi:pimeloyl-ACP methyl ester carboxylesterase
VIRHFQVAGGVRVVADVSGAPTLPPVVLLHGGGQTRHSWCALTNVLVKHQYHVVNLDSRGHGDSDWSPDGDYSLSTLSADLRTVIATLNQTPVLVGASMGGATAMFALGTAPATLASALVLVDFVPSVEIAGADRIRSFMQAHPRGFATLDEAAQAVHAYNPHRPRPADNNGLLKNLRRRADGRLYWHWDPRFLAPSERGEPPQFEAGLLLAARNINVPTLLARGLLSDIVSNEGVAKLRSVLPQLEVVDVAGATHMVAGDENDKFNSAVLAFLHRMLPRARPTRAVET